MLDSSPNQCLAVSTSPATSQTFMPDTFMPDTFVPMYALPAEITLFTQYALKSKAYIEFGCGGSTFLLCYLTQAQIFSVESNPAFINELSQNSLIQNALAHNRLRFYPINIGEVQKWGFPKDESQRHSFPLYSQSIFVSLDSTLRSQIDTIFIDGRFRVACALNAILYCPQSIIIIHDFFNRPHYHILLDFLECIDSANSLGIFQAKPTPDKQAILKLLEHYQFDPM